MNDAFSAEQLAQIERVVRKAVRDEMGDAGLRLDDSGHQDQAREDFRFMRRLRLGMEGVSSKIGLAVLAAILGGVFFVIDLGIKAWKASGGP